MAILQAFKFLGLTVWSPSQAIWEINKRPTWLWAFVILATCSATVSWITIPTLQSIPLTGVDPSSTDQNLTQLNQLTQLIRYLSVISVFPVTLILWFLSAFLLWLIVQVFEGLPDFKVIFSLIAHTSVVTLISSVIVSIFLVIKVNSGSVALEDLHIKLGLDLVWEKEHPALMVVLASVNPFTIWQYGLVGVGIAKVCQFTAIRSSGVLGLYWVLTNAFGAGITWVGHAVTGGGI